MAMRMFQTAKRSCLQSNLWDLIRNRIFELNIYVGYPWKFILRNVPVIQYAAYSNLLETDCFHTTAKCVIWIAHFELKFERRYSLDRVYAKMRNLKCAIQMMVRTIIWIAHFKLRIAMWFGVHTVQNTIIRIIIWITHFKLCIVMWFWRTHGPNYRLSNFNSKCAFRIKIQITHFAVVWKQS